MEFKPVTCRSHEDLNSENSTHPAILLAQSSRGTQWVYLTGEVEVSAECTKNFTDLPIHSMK